MVTFRNNNNVRRNNFRRNDRNFKRKVPGRNNHNAPKLIEKYNDLAREASSNGDKILSENYFQHADHFTRVQNEQESLRMARVNSSPTEVVKPITPADQIVKEAKIEVPIVKKDTQETELKKPSKTIEKKTVEKKSAAI